jgi:hypothetical protein
MQGPPAAQSEVATDANAVLKSPLVDIALIVRAESGKAVDLSPTGRLVATSSVEVAPAAPTAATPPAEPPVLAERDDLSAYTDSDHDGISDYDEVHINRHRHPLFPFLLRLRYIP